MMKKTLLFLSLTVAMLASAQTSVGDWQIYPMFGNTVDKVIGMNDKVYYRSAGTLYSYDSANNETYVYSTRNKLSDSRINRIYQNPDGGYIFIVYDNGNFDMLYDNGRVVNLPDLRDNNTLIDKTVNSVAFGKNRIYVATSFGMIVYDDKRHQVIESGIYNQPVKLIAEINGHIMMLTDGNLLISPLDERHNTLDKFTNFGAFSANQWRMTGDDTFHYSNGSLYKATIKWEKTKLYTDKYDYGHVKDLGDWKGGTYIETVDFKVVTFDADGEYQKTVYIPESLQDCTFDFWTDLDNSWFGSIKGISNFDISGMTSASSTPTMISDFYKPNAFTCVTAAFIEKSSDGNYLYFTNLAASNLLSCGEGDGENVVQTTNRMDSDGTIHDISIKNAWYLNDKSEFEKRQKSCKTTGMIGGTTKMVVDPENKDRYFVGNGMAGVFVVEGDEQVALWDRTNMPVNCGWRTRVYNVDIDPEGNLWVGHATFAEGRLPYYILPSNLRANPTAATMADWIAAKMPANYNGEKDMYSLFTRHGGRKIGVFYDGSWWPNIVLYDAGASWSDVSDDRSVIFSSSQFVDQDGNKFIPSRFYDAVEDSKGRVWVGTSLGIMEITNPSESMKGTTELLIRRPKVPRNDGTNYADYLLETDQINSIAIDNSGRKWVATEVSGVYLVSEDGDEIIANYTTANSYLPSNTVYSVMCDPNSNRVYFGTAVGTVSFDGTSAPARDDYTEVYAYPNPVRPEFTGLITVTGLMNNSLVKIADSHGNVMFQGRSEGGMITWDGCNPAGERVRSGVYYVFASQNGDGSSTGAVTKILVIN